MSIKNLLRDYFYSDFLRHCFIVLNTILFFFICFISLALDTRSPFNNINIILVGIFIGITILYMIQNKRVPRVNTFVICIIGLLTCMIVSYAVNGFKSFPRPPVLVTVFSLFVFLWLDNNREHLKFYLLAFLLASWCFFLLFTIIGRSYILHPNFSVRLGRDLGNENDVARHLVFVFLINLYFCYVFKPIALKISLGLICLVTVYYVFLTGSMSNIILVLISLFVFTFLTASKKTGIIVVVLTLFSIGAVIGLIFLIPAFEPIKIRVLGIFTSLFNSGDNRPDASTLGRLQAAVYGFRLFLENPLFGGGFNFVVNNYMIMAHNNVAEIGADYGVFAVLFEEIIILYPLIKDDNSSDDEKILTGMFGLYILLIQLFLVVFNSKVEAILLPLLFAVTNDKESFCKYNLFSKIKAKRLEREQESA